MKKLSRKLSLNRETILPLTPDQLDSINGGQAIASAITTTRTLTTTSTIPTSVPTSIPRTISVCPSRLICAGGK